MSRLARPMSDVGLKSCPPVRRGVHLRPVARPQAFLASTEWIDSDAPSVRRLAADLRAPDAVETARRSFVWVRDEVRHAGDHRVDRTPCRASEVLDLRAGWCFAKAHLLAALLRANGIPAGLAYQRLVLDEGAGTFTLHGLAAAQLPGHGWYRLDPRGNKPGIEAAFDPPRERLAWQARAPGERELPELHAAPLPVVVRCLTENAGWREVVAALPDASASPAKP